MALSSWPSFHWQMEKFTLRVKRSSFEVSGLWLTSSISSRARSNSPICMVRMA